MLSTVSSRSNQVEVSACGTRYGCTIVRAMVIREDSNLRERMDTRRGRSQWTKAALVLVAP